MNRVPKELEDLIELPKSCWHVWQWFMDLSDTRGDGFNGSLPITYTEIRSYFELYAVTPKPQDWEMLLIKQFDIAYLNNKRSKQK